MSSEQWSGRPPKRGRAEEGKTPQGGDAPGARPSGEEDGRFRGGAYSDYPSMFPPPPPGEGQPAYMHPMHPYPPGPGGPPPQWGHASFPPPMGYGMYPPPYQPGYPPPPYPGAQGMPPSYYDHSQGPPRYQQDVGTSPSGPPPPAYQDDRAQASAPSRGGGGAPGGGYGGSEALSESNELPDYDDQSESKMGPDTSSASRARLYVKSKVPTRQEILDRRARKNSQSRARAAKLRERIDIIQAKPESERTEEERDLFNSYQYRRQRKNDRSRERAIEKKNEIERILSKPENKRSKIENDFLEIALSAKQRKNQGDRLRRQRIKQMKRAQARAEASEYGAHSHRVASVGFSSGMSEIPMSPLPTPGGQHHPSMASPSMASPGMGITFPSPPNTRQAQGSSGARPGSSSGSGLPLPFVPPNQAYGTGDSPAARSQLHLPQQSSNVEQRRHADGSMTISIGGQGGGGDGEGAADVEGAESGTGTNAGGNVNLSDVSQLLMYGENNEEQEGGNGVQRNAEA